MYYHAHIVELELIFIMVNANNIKNLTTVARNNETRARVKH